MKKKEPYLHWECRDTKNTFRLRIVPERGGLITEWFDQGREILYFDFERFQKEELSVRGGIPILFPICGDLPRDSLKLPQGDFFLNQHGFARELPWSLKALNDNSGFSLFLEDSPITRSSYPYLFLLEIQVRPSRSCLNMNITQRCNQTYLGGVRV